MKKPIVIEKFADNGGLIDKFIGHNIKKYRKLAKMKQSDLSVILGLTRASIANYEVGNQSVSIKTAYKIAECLNIPIAKIILNKLPPKEELEKLLYKRKWTCCPNCSGKGKI